MYWIRLDSVVLGKALAAECVNLKQNPNRQKLRAPPVTFSGTMHTIYHFVNKFPMAAPLPTPQAPSTITITPLLLLLSSIYVMSERPYQWCWCCFRKCTSLLQISQDSASFIKKKKSITVASKNRTTRALLLHFKVATDYHLLKWDGIGELALKK